MAADRLILGENAIYSTDCEKTGLNNNAVVIGPSGCGKTMSVAEPMMIEAKNRSLIINLTKSRLGKKYYRTMRRRGYLVNILDFCHPEESTVGFDPLQFVNSYTDIQHLAEAIVLANPQKKGSRNIDPYWDDAAKMLLIALILYAAMTNDHTTLAAVAELVAQLRIWEEGGTIGTSLDRGFSYIEKYDPNCCAIAYWKSFKQLPIKTASCVYSALSTTMDALFSPQVKALISMEKQVDFAQIGSLKSALFILTSPVNPSLQCFVNIFYAQAFKSLFEFAESRPDGRLPIPVHMLCDDFATGSKILNFPEYISIFREKQISVTLLIQSESQLERMYGPEDAVTIINNCDTYLYMGGMDLKTCQSVSMRLNLPLDEVLYMPIGREYIFRRGSKPVITTRYNILKDKRYQEITAEYDREVAAQMAREKGR